MPERTDTNPRIATSRRQAEEWALVLDAAGIPHKLKRTADGWVLILAWRDEKRAADEINAFQQENPPAAGNATELLEYGKTYAGIAFAVAFVGFYFVTGPRDPTAIWFQVGSASAREILRGELWRTVTALTLHADASHLLGNAVSCVVFVTAVCRSLGPGVGSWLVLLTGSVGNMLTAFLHGTHHSSIGASTALFGAIGILAGLQFTARRRRQLRSPRSWLPIAAGLALLAMLGTGENADTVAHFFGFAVGVPAGAGTTLAIRRPFSPLVQWPLVLLAAAGVTGCWLVALAR